jgi:hypothetical protein
MANSSARKKKHPPDRAAPEVSSSGARPGLRAVPTPGKRERELDQLLSGTVAGRKKKKKGRRAEKPTEELPEELSAFGDILSAGRKIEREVDFKIRYAEQQVRQYCLQRFSERFAATGRRPESVTYVGPHSRFTYVQSQRITLTPEKAEALRSLGIPVDEYTELRGLKINYTAIREHKLEKKLRQALADLGLDRELLDEVFEPDVQLKPSFFDSMTTVLAHHLPRGEDLAQRVYEVNQILAPAGQIRNAETPDLDAGQAFKLIQETPIEATAAEFDEELSEDAG